MNSIPNPKDSNNLTKDNSETAILEETEEHLSQWTIGKITRNKDKVRKRSIPAKPQ